MKMQPLLVQPLDTARHDRSRFDCGTPALNRYLREQVSQDIRRRMAACFVAVDETGRIAGYYTVSTAGVPLSDLPDALSRKLPRYPTVPAVRLGRLAVDHAFSGQGLGRALLFDALKRAARLEIPAVAFIVDAKDEQAARFYQAHDFQPLADAPLKLFMPLAKVESLLGKDAS